MKSLIIPLFLVSIVLSAGAANGGSPSDANIHYVGRWDKSDPAVFHSYWSGAYLRTKFTGTSIGIKLDSNTGLAVSIDGETDRALSGPKGVTALNSAPLNPGTHTLRVGSSGQNYEVDFQGLVLDAGATTMPVEERPLIEYIGDSITQGNESLAWLSAEMLGCDHVQIAFSGVALSDGYTLSKPEKTGMETQYFRLKNFNHLQEEPVPWKFSYAPKAIVINLGQNEPSEPSEGFIKNYLQFVGKLRSQFPAAEIVAIGPFSGNHAEDVRKVAATLAPRDKHFHFVDTKGWLQPDDYRDHIHPNGIGNLRAGWRLANVLAPLESP